MSRFFIDRPVFAWVISIIIMGIGILSILTLPVAQYPQIAPPSVTINATYPGASAETVANTVTQVIEQQMTGLDGMRYMSSSSTSAGTSTTTLTFQTDSGVFSPGRLDLGSATLLRLAPPPPPDAAVLVDLGAGWGPLSVALARRANYYGAGADALVMALPLGRES